MYLGIFRVAAIADNIMVFNRIMKSIITRLAIDLAKFTAN